MAKKIILLAAGVLLGMLVINRLLRRNQARLAGSPSPSPLSQATPTNLPVKYREYLDASGFKFSYPENFDLKTKEIKDQSTYSALEITSPQSTGKIVINVVDSSYDSLEDWLAANEETAAGEVGEIKFADIKAKEIKAKDEIITAALDQGALFTIQVILIGDDRLWLAAYQNLISTFAFVPPPAQPNQAGTGPGDSTGDVIFEGEEIIE